jgi:hypothetical protein
VIGLQLAAAALTVVLVPRLALAVTGDHRAADVAALLACVDTVGVLWTTVPMTETVFTALTTAALVVLRRAWQRPATRDAVALGGLLAASAYVRPIAYPLGLIVPVMLAALGRGPRAPRLRAASIACAAFLLAVAPWHARNWHVAGYGGFSTLFDRAIYLSAGAAVAAHEQGTSFIALREARRADARDTWAVAHDVSADYARFRAQGLAEILRAPLLYATVHASGIVRVLLDPGAVEYFRFLGRYPQTAGLLAVAHESGLVKAMGVLAREHRGLFCVTVALGGWVLVTLAAAAWGVVRLWRGDRRADVWVLAGWATYFLLLSGGPHGISRFRHPIVPVVCVFACAGVGRLAAPGRREAVPATTASKGAGA